MPRRSQVLPTCALAFAFAAATAASAADSRPTAWTHSLRPAAQVETVSFDALDTEWLRFDDQIREQEGLAPRFAVPNVVSVTPDLDGTWESIDGETDVWRYRIRAARAASINLGFGRFSLPPGARLLIYPTDGDWDIRGPFTDADNEEHGQLWTPIVRTDDLMVELTIPRAERNAFELELTSINQGYRGFGTGSDSAVLSGSCNLDVECLDAGDSWRTQAQSVANLSMDGVLFCTGSLINNTANDRKMYFITANHCGVGTGNAASLVAIWNFKNSFCRTPGSASSGQPGDGSSAQFHTGSIFRASSSASDMTLVELDDPPVAAFNHYWAGWDRSTGNVPCSAASPCAAIHHPDNDEMRITYSTTQMVPSSWATTPPPTPGNGTHIWVHWATDPPGPFTVPGVTEPGSSGSPLYDSNHRFIGQLHGGASACGATGDNLSDIYGRFGVSWTGGGTDSTRLSNWLDPGNTGAMTLDGISQCTAPGAPAIGTATATAPNQLQVTWSNGSPASTTYNVYRAQGTCASPGSFALVGGGVAGSPYTDTAVSGGTTYAYRVHGIDETGGCESVASSCVQATATGACTLPPSFAGLTSATNNGAASCGVTLAWSAATAQCGGPLTYDVYRSTTPGFTPGPSTLLASGVTGTGYVDTDSLTSGTTYHYVVRARDSANTVQDANTVQRSVAPTGPVTVGNVVETFEGAGGFDNPGWTHSAIVGATDWALSTARSHTPTHSWFSDSLPSISHRELVSPSFVPQPTSTLSFWHTFAFENATSCFDAGTLEISTDGGGSWSVLPDAAFTAGGFNGTVSTAWQSPIGGLRAWCNGTLGTLTQVTANLGAFVGSSDVKLRWHAGDDVSVEAQGWFVDSVTLADVGAAGSCTSGGLLIDGFESGGTTNWSLTVP